MPVSFVCVYSNDTCLSECTVCVFRIIDFYCYILSPYLHFIIILIFLHSVVLDFQPKLIRNIDIVVDLNLVFTKELHRKLHLSNSNLLKRTGHVTHQKV